MQTFKHQNFHLDRLESLALPNWKPIVNNRLWTFRPTSMERNVYGAKRPWGELSGGRKVLTPVCDPVRPGPL